MPITKEIKFDIAVLLPAKDEALTIAESIVQLHNALPTAFICVIDNNCYDETAAIAQQTLLENKIQGQVIRESIQGKGHALKAALRHVSAARYVVCDADLTYPVMRVKDMLEMQEVNDADMVVGDRISDGAYKKINTRPFHSFGNSLVTKLTNFLFRQTYKDVASGFRVLSRRFVDNYEVRANGFELEIDLSITAAILNAKVIEVPISYVERHEGSTSKLNTYRDGFLYIKTLIMRFIAWRFASTS